MTEANNAATINAVVDGYFAMWNETEQGRRREVIAATWAQDACYVDPLFAAEGTRPSTGW